MDANLKKLVKQIVKYSPRLKREDVLAGRARLAERIRNFEQGGMVAIVYGGMDCDCCRWDNRVALVPAVPVIVERWIEQYHDGAEGPQWTNIHTPEFAKSLEPTSRDLALEAFEDGHPHHISY